MSDTTPGAAPAPATTTTTSTTPAVPPAPATTPPADELAALKAKVAEFEAKETARLKAEEDAKLTATQRREKAEADLKARVDEVERRAWELDLRQAGIPVEFARHMAVPAKAEQAKVLEELKATHLRGIEQARKGAPPPLGSGPISPATPAAPEPQPQTKESLDAKHAALAKTLQQARTPKRA